MASKAAFIKNIQKQIESSKVEKRKRILNTLRFDQGLPLDLTFQLSLKIASLRKNSHSNRTINRCILTGRRHGVHRIFKISRIKIKEFAARGIIPGVRRASW
jgi:small subunit ribosomal protein S14